MSLLLLACGIMGYLALALYDRAKARKVAYVVHIQGRTEESEHMDFAVNLFDDETEIVWEKKLNQAFLLREKRLKYQNDRIQEILERQRQEAAEHLASLKKDEGK